MKSFTQTYTINAPLEKVWKALIDPEEIDLWGAGPAVMDDQEGTEFKLWDGDIYGKNIEVVKNARLAESAKRARLVQEWSEDGWDAPSKVTFELSQKDGKTIVNLTHENVPDSEAKEIEDGWKRHYLGPLKKYVELT
ncbi:MAG: SRPBCC domain-containing protein [Candidatus Daviesbacteria bacterium]|nr:SRPBCC domain-containing protein [Candidatus Daviesbacteria bacterium]